MIARIFKRFQRLKLLLLLLALIFHGLVPADLLGAADTPPARQKLTKAIQILNLPIHETTNSYPVDLKGVVTLFDRRGQLFFIQDSTAGIYVYSSSFPSGLEEGQLVKVEGVSNQGQFSPIVDFATVTILGPGTMPSPVRIDSSQLQSGGYDCQRVQVEGVVHAQTNALGHLEVEIVSDGHRFIAWVFSAPSESIRSFIDVRIRVVGVAAALYDANFQPAAFVVFVARPNDVAVTDEAPYPLFQQPLQRVADLKNYSPRVALDHRVRVEGVVTMQSPGKFLFLQDGKAGIYVQSADSLPAHIGGNVEAVGFPVKDENGLALQDSVLRVKASTNSITVPLEVTVLRVIPSDLKYRLVQVEADLIHCNTAVEKQISFLVRTTDNQYLMGRLNIGPGVKPPGPFALGSRLRLTGVLVTATDSGTRERDLKLWMRSPDDLVVLRRPASWYADRLFVILGLLSGVIVAGAVWVGLMERRVKRETEGIRRREKALKERYTEVFENAYDIIYTHDLEGRLTSVNKAGERITGYSRDQLIGQSLSGLLAAGSRDLPRELMAKRAAGESKARFEVEMISRTGQGIFFEVDSQLEYQNNQPVGVKGFARDISARKLAEKALLHSESQLRRSLEERERISRDLHDGIIQSIYAIGLGLEDCRRLISESPPQAEHRLSRARDGLNAVIRDVRFFIGGIEARDLKGREFKTALKSLVLTMGENYSNQFLIDVDQVAADELNSDQTAHLLNIAKEAMSNSVRHAGAANTVVSLRNDGLRLVLEVKDDGAGFVPDSAGQTGMGLRNMAARAREMGATLEIISEPGGGTRLVLKIPRKT